MARHLPKPNCEFYKGHATSCCLRDAVVRVMSLLRGLLWLCPAHLKGQDRADLRKAILREKGL